VAPTVARPFAAAIDERVVTWEPNVAVELGLSTGPAWTARDQVLSGADIDVVATHPVVAGLGDPFAAVSVSGEPWSTITASSARGTVVGVAASDPLKAVVVADDATHRVMLPWSYDDQNRLTATGWRLFDQAVAWASG
jgi:hypothetical protein